MTDEHARESSPQPTRETATGGASRAVLEYGWASPRVGQATGLYHNIQMAFPIRICAVCSEEFELKPDKPGFANRCPACSEDESAVPTTKKSVDADERQNQKEANEARRRAMRDLLYRKDS